MNGWFRSRLLICTGVVVCTLVAGCAQVATQSDAATANAIANAELAYRQGDFDAAAQQFLALAAGHRHRRARFQLQAAQAYHENGELDASARVLDDIDRQRLQGDEVVSYDLLEAEVELSRNQPARALQLLGFADAGLPLPQRMRALELRARALEATGHVMQSARNRAALDRLLSGSDREQNEAQIVATLQKLPAASLTQEAQALSPNDALRTWINQALHAQGQALPLAVLHPNQPVGTLIPQAGNDVRREGYEPVHSIGLLVANTGALQAVSQPLRDGFFAAYFADHDANRPQIRVYNTDSTADEAIAAYRQAVADGVDRVVGPLSRDAVAALFAQGVLPVPLLALNQPDNGEPPPPGSTAFALTPDAEAAQAAEHMRERGIDQAVVITATEDWSERAALAFRAQFQSINGQILNEARVQDGQIDFASMIKTALAGVPPTVMQPPRQPGGLATVKSTTPSDIGIFISMRPQQARLLMPQLKLAGYTRVQVFGTSHIYAGDYSPGLDRDLDGVEFCDAPWLFDLTPGLPNHTDITRVLGSAHGAGGRLFAMGMDAYDLLPYLDWLGQHRGSYLAGATGQLTEDSLGSIQRLLVWARFDNGAAHPINGSLQMSNAPQ